MKVSFLAFLMAIALSVTGFFGLPLIYSSNSTLSVELGGSLNNAVTKDFLDPNSAQFRNVKFAQDQNVYGEVNAKNALGAYAGFKSFIYDPAKNVAIVETSDSIETVRGKLKSIAWSLR